MKNFRYLFIYILALLKGRRVPSSVLNTDCLSRSIGGPLKLGGCSFLSQAGNASSTSVEIALPLGHFTVRMRAQVFVTVLLLLFVVDLFSSNVRQHCTVICATMRHDVH